MTVENCHLFPRALGEILNRHQVLELHISLTSGLWKYEQWGYPVVDASPGVELWAWFKNDVKDIDTQWKDMVAALSGLFCASLNFIEAANSYSPYYSLKPTSAFKDQINSTQLRYAALPREVVCTENLTPWKKLLPCGAKRGVASLLNSGHIHNNRYHSLGLKFRQICSTAYCKKPIVEVRQTVSLIYDQRILSSRNWSLRQLFGQGLFDSCPVASSSSIYVDLSLNQSLPFSLAPRPHEIVKSIRGGDKRNLAKYDVKKIRRVLNIELSFKKKDVVSVSTAPLLHASQYISTYGQESGYIVDKIHNNYWYSLDVVLFKNIPWYLPVYLHTLEIMSNGEEVTPLHIYYQPGMCRMRPYHLELLLRLPARSVTMVSLNFEYMFLRWQEYPPDANHGFYIGSSIVTARLPNARNYTGLPTAGSLMASTFNTSQPGYPVYVRTESILLTLPTPDFSMPYNVICLACTVVALAFGPLHNITIKKMIYRSLTLRKPRVGKQAKQ